MLGQQIRAILATPHKLVLARLQGLVRSQAKLLYSNALLESGAAERLRAGCTMEELVAALDSSRADYVADVLALGVSLGALEAKGDRFRLKSRLLRAVTADDGGAIASLLREFAHYHGTLLRELPAQMGGARAPDYLAEYGDLVAGASRIVEPFLEPFADSIASRGRPLRILEIGCGSGVYLRRYAAAHPGNGGVAADLDPTVVAMARANVEAWGVADRFDVVKADVRKPPRELDGPFDLITSFQNVYYFTDEERHTLFSDVRARLSNGGIFALVTATSNTGFMSRYYDVLLNGTAGCHSFPTAATLMSDLRTAGFDPIERKTLLAGPGMVSLLAHASGVAEPTRRGGTGRADAPGTD